MLNSSQCKDFKYQDFVIFTYMQLEILAFKEASRTLPKCEERNGEIKK